MDPKQTRNVLVVMAGVAFLWILSPLSCSRRAPQPRSEVPVAFDASEAFRITREFATRYPDRVFGSFESRHASGYLNDALSRLGYRTEYTMFSSQIARRIQVGRNVLGYRQGASPEIIALVAHYDAAPTTVEGAMDNGSGVGVLLELARVLAEHPTNRSLLIIFSDGEEWGMLGALDIASGYPERNRIAAVLSLDHVAIGDLEAFRLEETGLRRGFTPPWYRILASRAAEAEGLPVLSPSGAGEHLERAFYIPWSDQGPFLQEGIPAVNLGSRSTDRARQRAIYHTAEDTTQNLKPASIGTYGRAAERIVRTLDGVEPLPRESMGWFRLWGTRYLGPARIAVLHAALLLPLLCCLYYCLKNHRGRLSLEGIGRELLACLATVLPFLMLYFSIGLFRKIRVLPTYALYPATLGDAVLGNPNWRVMWVIFGVSLLVAALCVLFYMYAFHGQPKQNFNVSKTVLLCLLVIVAVPALLHNSYWAATFLTLPCWIWSLTGAGGGAAKRLLHWIGILAAALPYGCVLIFLDSRFGAELDFIWYQVLALNTGLFSATGYFLSVAATALGVRFLVIQLHAEG